MHDTNNAIAGQSHQGGASEDDATTTFLFAVLLTLGTGATDVTAFTRLGNVFASVMTGNLVVLGFAVERLSGTLAAHTAVSFAGYVIGVAVGTRLVPAGGLPRWRRHRAVPALVVELALLGGFAAGFELTGTTPHGASQLTLLAVAAAAMGVQSAAASGLSSRVSTTYLTGTLTTVVAALVTRDSKRIQWREAAQIVALAAGAAAGGLVLATAPAALPALPMTAVVLVIAIIEALEPRPGGDRRQ